MRQALEQIADPVVCFQKTTTRWANFDHFVVAFGNTC